MISRLLARLKNKRDGPAGQVDYVSEPDYDYCVNPMICIATLMSANRRLW
jgi:hypothetical protein